MDKFFLFSNLIFNYKFKKWFLVKNKKNTNFNNIRLFKKKKNINLEKDIKYIFFLNLILKIVLLNQIFIF